LLAVVDNAIKTAGEGRVQTMSGGDASELPEPTAGGAATGGGDGTTPSTGNLGSAGIPGGTV
jgi:hypothetical protein